MVGARGATVDSLGRGSPQGANPLITTANHGRCYHVLRNADFAQRVGSNPTTQMNFLIGVYTKHIKKTEDIRKH